MSIMHLLSKRRISELIRLKSLFLSSENTSGLISYWLAPYAVNCTCKKQLKNVSEAQFSPRTSGSTYQIRFSQAEMMTWSASTLWNRDLKFAPSAFLIQFYLFVTNKVGDKVTNVSLRLLNTGKKKAWFITESIEIWCISHLVKSLGSIKGIILRLLSLYVPLEWGLLTLLSLF